MASPHPYTLRGNILPGLIIPDNNARPKLRAWIVVVRNSVVFFLGL